MIIFWYSTFLYLKYFGFYSQNYKKFEKWKKYTFVRKELWKYSFCLMFLYFQYQRQRKVQYLILTHNVKYFDHLKLCSTLGWIILDKKADHWNTFWETLNQKVIVTMFDDLKIQAYLASKNALVALILWWTNEILICNP